MGINIDLFFDQINYLINFDKFYFDKLCIQVLMTKKKKSPTQQPTEEIQMAGNKDIMVITGVKYLSLKENEYGHNHFFNVLDITPLQDLIELRKSLKMPLRGYSDKFYLKVNGLKIKELLGKIELRKDVPYIMDLTFSKYDFEKWWADYWL